MFTLGELELPSPKMGDLKRINLNDLHRPSRGGVFTHATIGPIITVYSYTFDVSKAACTGNSLLEDIKDFLVENRGQPVNILDHESRSYLGLCLTTEPEFVASVNGEDFTLDFQEIPQ